MNKINKQNINKSNFESVKPKSNEVKTMKKSLEKLINNIRLRAEREVPEYGDFAPVLEEFKNFDKTLEASDFMLKIVKPPKNIENHETLRYIELTAYKLPLPYKVTKLVGRGSKEEILKQLDQPDFLTKVEESFKSMSENLKQY